jgi:sugar phosphate isomerase/epimerase
MNDFNLSRRSFVAAGAAASILGRAGAADRYPVGLELYSVRKALQQDLMGTVTAVAKMGYQLVEFYSPYFAWTTDYARQVRKLLDELGVRCLSTHNGANAFEPENYAKAIELNGILGSRFVVMASPGKVDGPDAWKQVADRLNRAGEAFRKAGIRAGYHNHQAEFRGAEGSRPIDIVAQNTGKDVLLQLDVGTCVEVGADPVAWIEKNPGRFSVIHLKDYSREPEKGYKVLFGEWASPWKRIFAAAESAGGVEFYIIEQEIHDLPELEAAAGCLANYRKMRG